MMRKRLLLVACIAVAAAAILLWQSQRNAPDKCQSARPTVAVEPGEGVAPDSEMIANLGEYLSYYSIELVSRNSAPKCAGIPRFTLALSKPSGQPRTIKAELRDLASNRLHWHQDVVLQATPGDNPEKIATAHIAYMLGRPVGPIESAAIDLPWANENAREEYVCLYRFNQIYFVASNPDVESVSACLHKFAFTSDNPDFPVYFTFLELYKNRIETKKAEFVLNELSKAAIERAEELGPSNIPLLQLHIVEFRSKKDIDQKFVVRQLANYVERAPYDPRLLWAVSFAYGYNLDEYDLSRDLSRRAELIGGDQKEFGFGRLYANVGAQKWAELVDDRSLILKFIVDDPNMALMTLAMAPYGPSPIEDRKAARDWLAERDLANLPALHAYISGLDCSDRLKVAFNKIAAENFGDASKAGAALYRFEQGSGWDVP